VNTHAGRDHHDPFEPGGYGSDGLNEHIHALTDLLAPTEPANYPPDWTDLLFAVAFRMPDAVDPDPVAGVSAWVGFSDRAGDVSAAFVASLPSLPVLDATLTSIGDERAALDAAWNLLVLRYEPMDDEHLMVSVQVYDQPHPESVFDDKAAMLSLLDGDDTIVLST
jgi:hypothetical protein